MLSEVVIIIISGQKKTFLGALNVVKGCYLFVESISEVFYLHVH